MNTRWRKVAGDFRQHRIQILLIGLVLLLGGAAVVAALNARDILQREIAASYRRANPPDLVLWFDRVDARLLAAVRALPGVAAADARRVAATRVAGPDGAWIPTRLLVVRDFADQRTGLVHLHDGTWPSTDGGLLIEQSSLPLLGLNLGALLRVRTPGGGTAQLPIAGVVHDTAVAPSTQERIIYAYATPGTAARLGQGPDLDQLVVQLQDRSGIADTADALREALTKQGMAPSRIEALPGAHPHALLMNAMLRVLGVMAAMAFACSSALAAFVVSLWMKREVRQIGIMKTLGARSHQLAFQYLALVAPLVLAAAALALPLGTLAGRAVVTYYVTNLNIDAADRSAAPALVLAEVLGLLLIPLVAMALPVASAARQGAREAIHDPGITAQTAPRPVAARLVHVPGRRAATFALRNAFRRPWRLAVTLLALATGGALVLTSCNLYASLMRVVDRSLSDQGHDLEVTLPRPVDAGRLEALARGLPGVERAEAWRRAGVALATPADDPDVPGEPRRYALTGYPPDTRLLHLPAQSGRWPLPGESGAIVVTRFVQSQVRGLQIGSEFTLHFRGRRTAVHVVGVVDEVATPMLYTGFANFEAITGLGDASTDLRVKTRQPEAVAAAFDLALADARIDVGQMQTRANRREVLEEHFHVVTDVAKMVALAAALVGAICLAAFASLSVLERAREIGVIRTLGATPRDVTRLFVAESAAIAALSALLALGLSLVATRALNDLTSRQLLQVAVPLVISPAGLALLGGGLVVVLLGAGWPVARLVRGSVRDALAYE